MPVGETDIILHHYDASPFSAKVRMLLGLKRQAWRSVIMPNMMPKPDLVALTGGYRRAPVMQIGADVYCDSQMAMIEIERRAPSPAAIIGPAFPVNLWSDRIFFQATVAIIFGRIGDRVDPAFVKDREALSGRPFDTKAMAALAQPMRGQWRASAAWIEQALQTTSKPFLAGDQATLIDVCAYMNFWWLGGVFPKIVEELVVGLELLAGWRQRMATIGEGDRQEISAAEALTVAKDSQPALAPPHDPNDPSGFHPGDKISVSADDYGRDPIAGVLVTANPERVVIARETPDLGTLNLHFPRVGYNVFPA